MKDRITIHIATRDRWSELALLMQSLRTQTYENWDLLIVDDASGGFILQCQFIVTMINRIKLEGHKVKVIRNDVSYGCCYARNKCIEDDDLNNPLTCRLDDDVILEPNYLEELLKVIKSGYDIASGVVPLFSHPEIKREIKFVGDIINEHIIDSKGNLIQGKDECGFCYIENVILPTHQFRTNALYKSEINKKVKYPDNLTSVAFREEGFFSFKAIIEGYKIGINTGAVAYHLQTPSGGNRRTDYSECVKIDEQTWREWVKKMFIKHGNFLEVKK